ncbi:cytochrome P450 [Streptomyces sp. TRM66268-LWL]|uniref:Cytochrome P450 n=1 Tax=Streptomyces polyasparticus TaxID=2767826 RepID=A0ABR7SFX6_9ACTN|nr:cytochrome P450 [Streptomyces polyasparticus]MBC9714396.1 cytochrome P450 [Streptomyces polyasparticus]
MELTAPDSTFALAARGYAWLPALRRRARPDTPVRTRLLGRPVVVVSGPEAVRWFYDERHVLRAGAIPDPVLATLFGQGAVHTLDGPEHRSRKALFTKVLHDPDHIVDLTRLAAEQWGEAVADWSRDGRTVTLFDEAARILTRAASTWCGLPPESGKSADALAADLIAMVDGFGTAGPLAWRRARAARKRTEARMAALIEDVRAGRTKAPEDTPLHAVAHHTDEDGARLSARTAAVELINLLRPTAAVAWFLAFAAHALHHRPEVRTALRESGPEYAVAFAHEVRRFYPFVPFLGGHAAADLLWHGESIPAGRTVLLDVFGQLHDPGLWEHPTAFDPTRFLGRTVDPDLLVPQGGADPSTGHRCPGEDVVIALLSTLAPRLASLDYEVPPQNLRISLRRIPAHLPSGFRIQEIHAPEPARSATA